MIRLETLIELKFINSNFISVSSTPPLLKVDVRCSCKSHESHLVRCDNTGRARFTTRYMAQATNQDSVYHRRAHR